MSTLRIALAQINPTMGDFKANTAKIKRNIIQARKANADLIVCPEMVICGYPPEDLLLKPGFLADNEAARQELVRETQAITAVVGLAYGGNDKLFNSAALMDEGKLLDVYHKVELPNYGVFDEKRYFAPGCQPCFFELSSWRIAITICEDLWIENGVAENFIQRHKVDLIVNLSASPFHAGKQSARQKILNGIARRNRAYVAYVNLVGGQDELVFDGHSMIISPQGELVNGAGTFIEQLLLTDIEKPSRRVSHRPVSPKSGAGIRIKRPLKTNRKPLRITPVAQKKRLENIYSALVLGTRDYVKKNGFKKTVIGLSGGIDSSLTAAIATAALGCENVMGLTMPSQYTSPATRSDAARIAKNFRMQMFTVPIKPIFAVYRKALSEYFGPAPGGIAHENLQARIRGNILMAFSNRFGWLVLTTGNKSEVAVGYCTLYGDMAGGLAVIKDVPKTLVYELAQHVNKAAGRELIPQSVMERPPSAELRPNQKDEDSLPPYSVLDPILKEYVEEDRALEEIIAKGFKKPTVLEIIRRVDGSEYKRRQSPPGIKITPKAFGRDRRLPITNQYRP